MKTEKSLVSVQEAVEGFRTSFLGGLEQIQNACRIYVEALDRFPDAYNAFTEAFRGEIPEEAWARFALVGRQLMHPKLLWSGPRIRKAVALLPLPQQKKVMEEGVDLLLEGGDSLKVLPCNMTKPQLQQVFGAEKIRGLPEQRAWLESRRTFGKKEPLPASAVRYRIVRNRLVIEDPKALPLVLDRKELAVILAGME